jgi:hypothetical protein
MDMGIDLMVDNASNKLEESGFQAKRIVQDASVAGVLVTKEREVDQY